MAKVLVIEDNPQNLMLAQLVLEKAGHTVLSAVDGTQGLELARQVRPDLVVLDILDSVWLPCRDRAPEDGASIHS
jgi:two-component system cell cycle response regulator DivK